MFSGTLVCGSKTETRELHRQPWLNTGVRAAFCRCKLKSRDRWNVSFYSFGCTMLVLLLWFWQKWIAHFSILSKCIAGTEKQAVDSCCKQPDSHLQPVTHSCRSKAQLAGDCLTIVLLLSRLPDLRVTSLWYVLIGVQLVYNFLSKYFMMRKCMYWSYSHNHRNAALRNGCFNMMKLTDNPYTFYILSTCFCPKQHSSSAFKK